MIRIRIFILSVLVLLPGLLPAEILIDGNYAFRYDDNVYQSSGASPDQVHLLGWGIGWQESRWQAVYLGDMARFQKESDLNYVSHGVSATAVIYENPSVNFTIDGLFSQQKYEADWTLYDMNAWEMQGTLTSATSRTLEWRTNTTFRQGKFPELSIYDFSEWLLHFDLAYYAPSRTTLSAALNWGVKNWLNGISLPDYSGNQYNGNAGYRKGHLWPSMVAVTAADGTNQFFLTMSVAQAITRSTGIRADYSRYFTPAEKARYLVSSASYRSESILADDAYAYSSHEIKSRLTQILPWQSRLIIGFSAKEMNFMYQAQLSPEAIIAPESPKRKDAIVTGSVTVEKTVPSIGQFEKIRWQAGISLLNRVSNHYYFDYHSFQVETGIIFSL
ncbi:hypothetical protein KAH55_11225 [bacterium]|nr:hypothetical protein [bacterium]